MAQILNDIKKRREEKKITQKDLADIVGVRRETIVRLEQNKYSPSLELAMLIAKEFNVLVDDIFGME